MKYGWPQKHLDPSCLGFSPEPAISSVPQLVGFNPEQGQCKAVQVDEPEKDQESQGAKVGHNLNPLGFSPVTPKDWLGQTDRISSPHHPDLGFSPILPCKASRQGDQAPNPLEFPLLDIKDARIRSNREAEDLIRKATMNAVCQHSLDRAVTAGDVAAALLNESFSKAAEVLSSLSSLTDFVRRLTSASSNHAFMQGQNENAKEDRARQMFSVSQTDEVHLGLSACIQPGAQANKVQLRQCPPEAHAGERQLEQPQVDVASLGRRGNLNLILGYDVVGRTIVSSLGGEEPALYNLGTSSVSTMYRVATAIGQEVARCSDPRRASGFSQDQSVVNLNIGSRQAAVDPLSQVSSVRSIVGSSEAVRDCRQQDAEAQEFPGNHLVWFVLLKEGALCEYAGSQGMA